MGVPCRSLTLPARWTCHRTDRKTACSPGGGVNSRFSRSFQRVPRHAARLSGIIGLNRYYSLAIRVTPLSANSSGEAGTVARLFPVHWFSAVDCPAPTFVPCYACATLDRQASGFRRWVATAVRPLATR